MKVQEMHRGFIFNRQGASAIEFAIVGPLFLLIIFGMIAYGIYLGAAINVEQLAADAARASLAGLDEEERQELASEFIEVNSAEYMLIDPEYISVSVAGSAIDPNQFKVAVRYDATKLPIWNLYLPLPLPGKVIERSSVIRIGGI